MRTQDAVDMLHSAFGPGDLASKVDELVQNEGRFGIQEGKELMQWIAEQLTDEDNANEDQEGTEG
jgi:ubiquinone biosynthesis protein UbiJ